MCQKMNIVNRDALAGAIYFVVGRGTEGGASSYHLSIAGVTSGVSDPGWGDADNVVANSGYSIGTIQVDLGQRGTWPLGAIENGPLKSGEKAYVDAIIDQALTYAKEHDLKFTGDLDQLRNDLLSHGNGRINRQKISFIDKDTRDSINAWASSADGRRWIHHNIDYPQIRSLTDISVSLLDRYGNNISEDRHLETISILVKTANQMPSQLDNFKKILESGGNYDDVFKNAKNIKERYGYYDGPKAGVLAEKYKIAYNDSGRKERLDKAHIAVSGAGYDPSKEENDLDIKEALSAIGQSTDIHARTSSAGSLRQGAHGQSVSALQADLAALGYTDNLGRPLRADGHFQRNTEAAVRAFQSDHGLFVDGIAGKSTLEAIGTQRKLLSSIPALATELEWHPRARIGGFESAHGVTNQHSSGEPALPEASVPVPNPFADPRHPDHGLYAELKERIPDASENRLGQMTVACHVAGIRPGYLGDIHIGKQGIVLASYGPGPHTIVDISLPAPPIQHTVQQMQAFDFQLAQQQQFDQQQAMQRQGPVVGSQGR